MRAETGNNAHTGSRQSHTTRAATAVADGFGKGVGVFFFFLLSPPPPKPASLASSQAVVHDPNLPFWGEVSWRERQEPGTRSNV